MGELSAQAVVEELHAIAMAKATDVLQVRGGKLEVADIQDMAAVASIETTSSGLKVKFYDKLKALELLGKCLGLFSGDVPEDSGQSTLLHAILDGTREEVALDDLPEAEQAAEARNDLVEPGESS